jgi:hypothetical protein
LVSGKREYKLPKRGDLDSTGAAMDGLIHVKGVSIKFKSTDTEYTKLDPSSLENKEEDLLSYAKTVNPFYTFSDNSVFLYPSPTESITGGIIIYGIFYPKKVALVDEDILPDQHQKAILLGMAERYFSKEKLFDQANLAGTKFKEELARVASSISGRIQSPIARTIPNISYLE